VARQGQRCRTDEDGIDSTRFLISSNAGEELKPLAKIASGGEISRAMLAIKSILAEVDAVPVLVFDEIDVGIGGRVAEAVGRKLREIGPDGRCSASPTCRRSPPRPSPTTGWSSSPGPAGP